MKNLKCIQDAKIKYYVHDAMLRGFGDLCPEKDDSVEIGEMLAGPSVLAKPRGCLRGSWTIGHSGTFCNFD